MKTQVIVPQPILRQFELWLEQSRTSKAHPRISKARVDQSQPPSPILQSRSQETAPPIGKQRKKFKPRIERGQARTEHLETRPPPPGVPAKSKERDLRASSWKDQWQILA